MYINVICLIIFKECVTGIRAGDLKSSYGNHIKASDKFMAFNVDTGGKP